MDMKPKSFKTVNGMEACTTTNNVNPFYNGKPGFKTVNGMEACATSKKWTRNTGFKQLFQNRKRYGGMRDFYRVSYANFIIADVSKP